jgi:hypothetical protein
MSPNSRKKLENSGLAGLGVPGHQQGLQLLIGVGGGLVNVPEAVGDVGTDLCG